MFNKFTIAENIQRIMREKDIKPRDIIRRVQQHGGKMTPSTLSNYLTTSVTNNRKPDYPSLLLIAKSLKVSVSELLGPEFQQYELESKNFIDAGSIALHEKLGYKPEVFTFEVTDNYCEPFKAGDVLIVEPCDNATVGHYLMDLHNIVTLVKCVTDGKTYSISINGDSIEMDAPKVIGKVVATLTKQF